MKHLIADNKYYHIEVDDERRRLYIQVKGFWASVELVPDYLTDLQRAMRKAGPRFTSVVDTQLMLTHPVEVREKIHEAAVLLAIKSGSVFGAQICSRDFITNLQADKIAAQTKAKVKVFADVQSADEFLDTISLG